MAHLREWTRFSKEQHHPNSVRMILAPVFLFLDANEIEHNRRTIVKMFPKRRKFTNAEGYKLHQIQTMVKFWDNKSPRNKAITLTLATTGVREGAIPLLKVGDVTPIEDCFMFVVYRGEDEEYVTFCTPETRVAIEEYLDIRRGKGEKITDASPLFIWNYRKIAQRSKVSPITEDAIASMMGYVLEKNPSIQRIKDSLSGHYNIALVHGLRKFCDTQLEESGIKDSKIQKLIGHKNGLTGLYFDAQSTKLFADYKKAIPLLIISKETRQQSLIDTLQLGKTEDEIQTIKIIEDQVEHIKFLETRIDEIESNHASSYKEHGEQMITLSEATLEQIVSAQVKKELTKHHNKEETANLILPPITLFDKLGL